MGGPAPGVPALRRCGDLVVRDSHAGESRQLGGKLIARHPVEHHDAEQIDGGTVVNGARTGRRGEPAARGMPGEDERLRQHAVVAGRVGADVQCGPVTHEHLRGGIPGERGIEPEDVGCHHDAVGLLRQRLSHIRVPGVETEEAMLQPDHAVGLNGTVGLSREVPVGGCVVPVDPGGNEQRSGPGPHTGHPIGLRRGDERGDPVGSGVDRRRRGQAEELADGVDQSLEHGVQRGEIVGVLGGQAHRGGIAHDDLTVGRGVQPVLRRLRCGTGVEVVDPAGAQVVDGRGAARRGELGDQLRGEVDDRIAAEHRVHVRAADQHRAVELVGPGGQQLVGGGAEDVERLRGRGDLIDRDVGERRQLLSEGAVEGAVGDTVEHQHAQQIGVLGVTARIDVVGGRRTGEPAAGGMTGEDECALEFDGVADVSGRDGAFGQGRAGGIQE